MDYAKFRNPAPPKSGPSSGRKTQAGQLRVVSYLWNTTVPGNRFGTDGAQPAVPPVWPGDHLRSCRQWHGVNLEVGFQAGGSVIPDSIMLDELSYSGSTETCGMVGKTTVTDRHVTEPRIGSDADGPYVEVKTLLGTRLGAFIPDIDVGVPAMSSEIAAVVAQHIIEEVIEQTSEEQYLGTNSWAPKIFTYARLKLYSSGAVGDWVSKTRGSGFVSQEEIIQDQIGASWIPEHHLYVNGALQKSLRPTSANHRAELQKWAESDRPFDVFAFQVLTEALEEWADTTSLSDKQKAAKDFRKRYPDYFIRTLF